MGRAVSWIRLHGLQVGFHCSIAIAYFLGGRLPHTRSKWRGSLNQEGSLLSIGEVQTNRYIQWIR